MVAVAERAHERVPTEHGVRAIEGGEPEPRGRRVTRHLLEEDNIEYRKSQTEKAAQKRRGLPTGGESVEGAAGWRYS